MSNKANNERRNMKLKNMFPIATALVFSTMASAESYVPTAEEIESYRQSIIASQTAQPQSGRNSIVSQVTTSYNEMILLSMTYQSFDLSDEDTKLLESTVVRISNRMPDL